MEKSLGSVQIVQKSIETGLHTKVFTQVAWVSATYVKRQKQSVQQSNFLAFTGPSKTKGIQ